MRYTLAFIILLLAPLEAGLTVKTIDKMVNQILGKRKSKIHVNFQKVISPFIAFVPVEGDEGKRKPIINLKQMNSEVRFRLKAIINDQALINGEWIRVGEKIQGYELAQIKDDHVVLKKTGRTIEIFLPKPKKLLQLQISEG